MADTTTSTPALTANLSEAGLDQLDSLLSNQPVQGESASTEQTTETATEATAETNEAAQAEQEQAAEQGTEAEAESDSDESDQDQQAGQQSKKGKQFRFRAKDEKDEAFGALLKAGKSPLEAAMAVYGSPTAAKEAATVETKKPEGSPFVSFDKEIAEKTSELANLEKALAAATEDADLPKLASISREIARKERDIERAQDRRAAAEADLKRQQDEANQAEAQKASRTEYERAVELFPELGVKDSAERKAFDEFYKKALTSDEYATDIKNDAPGWRLRLAKDFALENGLVPAHRRKAVAPPAKHGTPTFQQPTAPGKQAIRPQASAARVISSKEAPSGGATPPVFDPSMIQKMSVKELDALMSAMR